MLMNHLRVSAVVGRLSVLLACALAVGGCGSAAEGEPGGETSQALQGGGVGSVLQLKTNCENDRCYTQAQCLADGEGSACTCLAQWYACIRTTCGESRPVISCRF
jgi:hypothetical protein